MWVVVFRSHARTARSLVASVVPAGASHLASLASVVSPPKGSAASHSISLPHTTKPTSGRGLVGLSFHRGYFGRPRLSCV